jgi:predicted amidohydrolase YtcJ
MTKLLITNARVWTVDRSAPRAEALAIEGDRIVAVGSNHEILERRGPGVRVLDAGGRLVLPGFIDAHVHFMVGSAQLGKVDLRGVRSFAEMAARIGEQTRVAGGRWVRGGGWDEQAWEPAHLPNCHLIDPFSQDTPVFVYRCDLHTALANSVALELAGISASTLDPKGGVIVRDDEGRPTGILKDSAIRLVERVVPAPSRQERLAHAADGLRYLASFGVTGIHDMNPSAEDLDLYAELADRNALTVRIYAAPLETEVFSGGVGRVKDLRGPFVRTGAVKGFTDGSLGSSTALFFEPYSDEADTRGLLSDEMQPPGAIRRRLIAADSSGMQICLHAIGDRAISMTLDLFEDLQRVNGPRDRRLRIEHAQHLHASDFARFAKLGVIASVQPSHLLDDGRWAERRIGGERVLNAFAFRSFLDHGVRLAFGTDWPVASPNPALTLYAAATRIVQGTSGKSAWVPEQRVSVAQAVEASTMGSAFAGFAENDQGSISPGKLADIVMLSDDVLSMDPAGIKDVIVEMTIVGGRIVHDTSGLT